jgi:hypothetical protein
VAGAGLNHLKNDLIIQVTTALQWHEHWPARKPKKDTGSDAKKKTPLNLKRRTQNATGSATNTPEITKTGGTGARDIDFIKSANVL